MEESTPFIPARGMRRIVFTPRPSGFRFYHTHLVAPRQCLRHSGEVGAVYIEPKNKSGNYDREVFLVLKEFEPYLRRGGDMPQDLFPEQVKLLRS